MNTTNNRRSRSSSTSGTSSRRRTFSSSRPRNNKPSGTSKGHIGARNHSNRRRGSGRKMPTFNPSQFINTNPVDIKQEVYKPKHSFNTFGLDKRILRAVTGLGIDTPSPIQDQAIPEILAGHDVVGLAETGTGKTAAFLLPIIEKTLKDSKRQTLILTPTRELAIQIDEELKKLSSNCRMYSVTCVGGINIQPQIRALRRNNSFIIGTPGRVLDLINRKKIDTSHITTVVLDEADRMLDMGFIHDMRSILSGTPKNRETLFFSATMSKDIENLVSDFLNDPIMISVKKKDVTNSIAQDVVRFEERLKFKILLDLLSTTEFKRVLVFGAMKHSVEKLSRQLEDNGVKAESIHGNKGHGQRQRALTRFKEGHAQVLVATDVAARGIHVDDVTHVINYDLPNTFEDYVHRIGRTGRGTKRGKALTFVPLSRNKTI